MVRGRVGSHPGASLGGWGGEFFFGHGAGEKPFRVGTSFHAAGFPNLFLQIHGARDWTLVSHKYSQYMRPMHADNHVIGFGAYNDWRTMNRTEHFSRIPRIEVTTLPGDVLYIPPWWWHEVILPGSEFSIGLSNRGIGWQSSWSRAPLLRFIPWISGELSVGGLTLDTVQMLPALLKGWQRLGSIQSTQHGV